MKTIRIGTRASELALWQANTVSKKLEDLGFATEIVKISSKGDVVLDKPLYRLGVVGVFTKTLDIALLNDEIDIAVHSLKDVPTQMPEGIMQAAVLERGNVHDIVVLHPQKEKIDEKGTIATGSLRRKAQWLYKYPNATLVDLRGNVNLRMQKLSDSDWNGAIFAKTGLERINILPDNHKVLDWMIPAPAQGAVLLSCLQKEKELLKICEQINHKETEICVDLEREFLQVMEGGCTAPIGASASINDKKEIEFVGALFSLDGKEKLTISEKRKLSEIEGFGRSCAKTILDKGGKELMQSIKKELNS